MSPQSKDVTDFDAVSQDAKKDIRATTAILAAIHSADFPGVSLLWRRWLGYDGSEAKQVESRDMPNARIHQESVCRRLRAWNAGDSEG